MRPSLPAILWGSLFFFMADCDVYGQVRLRIEYTLDSPGRNMRLFRPSQRIEVFTYADNLQETNATWGLEWKIDASPGVSVFSALQPFPYYTYWFSNFNDASYPLTKFLTNDFFEPFLMNSASNFVRTDLSRRFTSQTQGGLRVGPFRRRGLISFQSLEIGTLGDYKIGISGKAWDVQGNPRPVETSGITVKIISTEEYNRITSATPLLILDLEHGHPRVHVTQSSSRLKLEYSDDLRFVSPSALHTSSYFYPRPQLFDSIDLVDTSVSNGTESFPRTRFYRAANVPVEPITVSLIQPNANVTTVVSNSVRIVATAQSPSSQIRRWELWHDWDGFTESLLGAQDGVQFDYNWITPSWDFYRLSAVAYDEWGRRAASRQQATVVHPDTNSVIAFSNRDWATQTVFDGEFGDEIALGRTATIRQFRFFFVFSPASVKVRLYRNDGQQGQPQTMVYESEWLRSESRPGGNLVELDVSSAPPIRLDRFTYTVEIEKGAQPAGKMILGSPDIGEAQTPGWEKGNGTWRRIEWVNGWKLSAQIVVSRE